MLACNLWANYSIESRAEGKPALEKKDRASCDPLLFPRRYTEK
jgi:hypothetical protein